MLTNLNHRTIKILFDLQATQTEESRQRGVGRYSRELFEAILKLDSHQEIYALFNSAFPIDKFKHLSETRKITCPLLPDWQSERNFKGGDQDFLDSLAYSAIYSSIKPDIIHISHIFEGFHSRAPLPCLSTKTKGQLFTATFYDLIPLRFKEHYFNNNTNFERWYHSRINYLLQMDLLFAISESSKWNAVNLLNIDPDKIITLPGGVSGCFKPVNDLHKERHNIQKKYKLNGKFILYTGGDDYRKNILGAIRAFAIFKRNQESNYQLVIACSMGEKRKKHYLSAAIEHGLNENDLIFTGYISQDDLVSFYATCDLFIFPSLYEGFGLPVLEAMACGAPVIGADNSSIKEIIDTPEALFDANCANSIADKMSYVLNNENFSNHLKTRGLEKVNEIGWDKSAIIISEAVEQALLKNHMKAKASLTNGWYSKKRMAMLTPLPPCKSGIADYNAKFIPYLSKYFDIDIYVDQSKVDDNSLNGTFRIFQINDFDSLADLYDIIFYEIGNSEFHTHALRLCTKHPGVIGLHDAYISGLIGYIEYNLGNSGYYEQEMLYSHQTLARQYLSPIKKNHESIGNAMIHLPCTKRILDSAIGVISHSVFNLDTSRSFYPDGFSAPYRIINQMVSMVEPSSLEEKNKLKSQFNFTKDDFIVCTFGHITWNKCGDLLLEAFIHANIPNTYLIYVGELPQDDYGKKITQLIKKFSAEDKVIVTGFVEEKTFENYLKIATLAVQLRIHSRGGTPKGVLDCLNNQVPVIVNNDASYKDYPEGVTYKIDQNPTVENIKQAITLLHENAALRKELSDNGRDYLANFHNPEDCAASYAVTIHEFIERHRSVQKDYYLKLFLPYLAQTMSPYTGLDIAEKWLDTLPQHSFVSPRLLIDVSHIAQYDHNTGIQRVVRQIITSAYCSASAIVEPVAFQLKDGQMLPAQNWLAKVGILLPNEAVESQTPIELRPGDKLLMLDSSWDFYSDFIPVFERARAFNIPIYTVVYDILPITLPPNYFVPGGKEWFENWLKTAVAESDGLVCISKATADDVIQWLQKESVTAQPKIGYWHLGCDFDNNTVAEEMIPERVAPLLNKQYLLMVGTIEPRKSHELALTAMELLWANNNELCLCIAGKEGWMTGDLIAKIKNHPLRNQNLFLIDQPTDLEIKSLYKHATGLLFISKGEGFGLPLVEAANFDLPIICSDLPVLREIASNHATYVDTTTADVLANDIETWYRDFRNGKIGGSAKMPRLTWNNSVQSLYNVVINNEWYRSEDDCLHTD